MAVARAFSTLVSVSSSFKTATSRKCALFLFDQLIKRKQNVNLVFTGKHLRLGRNTYEGLQEMIREKGRLPVERALGKGFQKFDIHGGVIRDQFHLAALMYYPDRFGGFDCECDEIQAQATAFTLNDDAVAQIKEQIPLTEI